MKTVEEYMALPYRLEIIPDNEVGGFAACYPELRGCVAVGHSFETLIAAAKKAKKVWIEKAVSEGIEIPEPDLTYRAEILDAVAKAQNKEVLE